MFVPHSVRVAGVKVQASHSIGKDGADPSELEEREDLPEQSDREEGSLEYRKQVS